jgi:carboxymethylenebutenolidase
MQARTTEIRVTDSVVRAYEVIPDGAGPHAGVLLCMDGLGVRDALRRMADRLGAAGYHVLLPSYFHRLGPDVHFDPKEVFSQPEKLAEMRKTIGAAVTTERAMSDTAAFLDHLAAQPDVDGARLGVVGYCMGGRLAFLAASTFPDRVRAAASIHGGGLVTPAPDSPHLVASKVRARLYFGIAKEDSSCTPEQAATLDATLREAGVRYAIEHYDARHGWAVDDTPVHDAGESERHWQAVLGLFASELSG